MKLRRWRAEDRPAFRRMNADARVMEFMPGPLSAEETDAQADRIAEDMARQDWGLWAVEVPGVAEFGGYVGLKVPAVGLPFGPCVEVAWRLDAALWGRGYATEAARVVLDDGFTRLGLAEIISFTALPNLRSRAVMERLGMRESDEFEHPLLPEGHWLRRHVLYRKTAP
ncbi:MAG: GNAT family N-acetyltransferase [Magnetospirillum sp.]|nr:GNAT family N-acetyltransferase [Magnetospirillum sp.]